VPECHSLEAAGADKGHRNGRKALGGCELAHSRRRREGGGNHSEFLRACRIDAEAQKVAWELAISKAQETLEYYDRPQNSDDSASSLLSSRVSTSSDHDEALEAFTGSRLSCTVERYVTRILKYTECSDCNIVLAFLFMERIRRDYPTLHLSPYNLQRLLLVACMVASKVFDDIYYSNRTWAQVGELTVAEVNSLELKFLGCLNFNCFVPREEYDQFVHRLRDVQRLLCQSGHYDLLFPDRRRRGSRKLSILSISSQHSGSGSFLRSPTASSGGAGGSFKGRSAKRLDWVAPQS